MKRRCFLAIVRSGACKEAARDYLLDSNHDTRHETVNHSIGEYVRADVHTNTVEGVWSLFKRSIVGSYHQISTKHMPAYLDEIAFRFDNRQNPYLFRDTVVRLLAAKTVSFKTLISVEA